MPEVTKIDHDLIKSTMEQPKAQIPGVSIAYAHEADPVETTVIGKMDKEADPTEGLIDTDTQFGAASLSKPVFAYLVLKLIEKGILSRPGEEPKEGLDRPLHEILPLEEFYADLGGQMSRLDMRRAEKITPRLLLSHQSGLGLDDRARLHFEPGTEYAYSGMGLWYLQKVIEKATGSSLEELAKEYVFSEHAVGMPDSTFLFPHGNKPPCGANSLHTTATDYAKFMMTWMQDPSPIMQEAFKPQVYLTQDHQILPREDKPAAKDVPISDKMHLAWGLGVGLELDAKGKPIRAFHTGDMDQYRAQVACNLERGNQSCIVYFANGVIDEKKGSGHILGPLIITPKVPIPHAYAWFYEKFRFARHWEEISDVKGWGERVPKPALTDRLNARDSTAMMLVRMPSQTATSSATSQQRPHEEETARNSSQNNIKDEHEEEIETNTTVSPSPTQITPKPPGTVR